MSSKSTKDQTLMLNISGNMGAIDVILLFNERYTPKESAYVLIKGKIVRSRSFQGHHTNWFEIKKYNSCSSQTCEKKVKGQGEGQVLGDRVTKIMLKWEVFNIS